VFGNVDSISKERVEELNTFDRLKGERGLVVEEKARKSLVTNELEKSILQEIRWRQKSRVRWLKEAINALNSFIGLPTRTGDSIP
jgi:hypothetical protein